MKVKQEINCSAGKKMFETLQIRNLKIKQNNCFGH